MSISYRSCPPQPEEATIADLKCIVTEKSSIPAATQRLMFKGKVLKDDDQVKASGLSDGCTVLLLKLRTPTTMASVSESLRVDSTPDPAPAEPATTAAATPSASTSAAVTSKSALQPSIGFSGDLIDSLVTILRSTTGVDETSEEGRKMNMMLEGMKATVKLSSPETLRFAADYIVATNGNAFFDVLPQLRDFAAQDPNLLRSLTDPAKLAMLPRLFTNSTVLREMLTSLASRGSNFRTRATR